MTAASLHLTAILAKAETNPGARATYDRYKVLYSGQGTDLSNQLRARLESCVDAQIQYSAGGGAGGAYWLGDFHYNWGADEYGYMAWASKGEDFNTCVAKSEAQRNSLYQALTVHPIQGIVNPAVDTSNKADDKCRYFCDTTLGSNASRPRRHRKPQP
jgi:hypothetical protein